MIILISSILQSSSLQMVNSKKTKLTWKLLYGWAL